MKRRLILHLWNVNLTLQISRREEILQWKHKTRNTWFIHTVKKWTASSEFGIYRLCEQRRFRRACASAQSRQNLRCSLIQAMSQEEPSDRKPDPWPLWMAGHAQLKFVMTECSKTQICLTRPKWWSMMINVKMIIIEVHFSTYKIVGFYYWKYRHCR